MALYIPVYTSIGITCLVQHGIYLYIPVCQSEKNQVFRMCWTNKVHSCTYKYIQLHTFMYTHTKVTTNFHFKSGLHLEPLEMLICLVYTWYIHVIRRIVRYVRHIPDIYLSYDIECHVTDICLVYVRYTSYSHKWYIPGKYLRYDSWIFETYLVYV
jgi:hypothetical protein